MKIALIKRTLKRKRNYTLIEDAYGNYGVFDEWNTLIRYFLSEKELLDWIRMLRILKLI